MRDELLSLIKKIEIVREAGDALASGAKGLNLFGLADTQKGCFLTALTGLRKNNGPLVFLLPGRDECVTIGVNLIIFILNRRCWNSTRKT